MYRFDTTPDTSRGTTSNTSCDTSCDTTPDTTSETTSDTTSEHLVRPYLINTKHIVNFNKHIINNNKQYKTKEGEEKKSSPHPSQNKNDESSFRKDDLQSPDSSDTPKKKSPTKRTRFVPPELKEVKTFFHENKSS